MRKAILCLAVLIICSVAGFGKSQASEADANSLNNLWAYYGFGEIEIIKLAWNIKCLQTADFDNDGLKDIAVVNNTDSRIELLLQKKAVSSDDAQAHLSDVNESDINELNPPSKYRKVPVPVSVKMANLVNGDLNSDGLTDLAFYGEPRALYILLQKKAGPEEKKGTLSWKALKKIKIDDGLLKFKFARMCRY